MERGETDVGHFLFAKNDVLIGRGIVRLREISSGHRGCRCVTQQRKTQSGGTQHGHGGRFGGAFLLRSLLEPSHGLLPPQVLMIVLELASVRSAEPARKGCLFDKMPTVPSSSHSSSRRLEHAAL